MVSINYASREISCKIVFYGPGLSGKTTNLRYVHKKVPSQTRGELISLATDTDRTLFFDFLPLNLGAIQGFSTKFQLYTVPGQVYYNATRKLVLRGVDGLVFVADSQLSKMDENIESLNNLVENLREYGYKLEDMPMLYQYNKRDLPNIASIEDLEKVLNPRQLPYFEAVATKGIGVFDTLKSVSKLVMEKIRKTQEVTRPEQPTAKRESPERVEQDSGYQVLLKTKRSLEPTEIIPDFLRKPGLVRGADKDSAPVKTAQDEEEKKQPVSLKEQVEKKARETESQFEPDSKSQMEREKKTLSGEKRENEKQKWIEEQKELARHRDQKSQEEERASFIVDYEAQIMEKSKSQTEAPVEQHVPEEWFRLKVDCKASPVIAPRRMERVKQKKKFSLFGWLKKSKK